MSTLMHVKEYICENDLDNALKAIETLKGEELQLGRVVKSRILIDKGYIIESLDIINEILNQEIQGTVLRFGAIMSKIRLYLKTGKYTKIPELKDEGDKILESVQDIKSDFMLWIKGNYFNDIGNYYWDKGSLSKALESYDKGFQFRKELGSKIEIAKSLTNLGNIHYIRGEYDLALKKYAETIILKKEVEHNVDLSAVLSNIGAVHLDKGELNKALAYFNQSLRYISNSNDEAAKAFRYINIGRIYIIKGDLDIALDFLGKASEVYKNLENKFLLARSLSFTGSIYLYQKKLDLAEKYLLLSLEYHNSFENAFQVSKTLYIMIQVKVEQVQRLEASSYLQRLKKIEKQKANPIVTLRYLLAKALIYKRENRLSRKYSAMELYQKIIQNPLLNGIIKMEAKLGFCELLIMEFELLMNPILPDEIFALIDQIYKYGQQEQAYTFIINGLILKSRMVFIQKEITKAYKLLEIADFYCDERQLSLCKSKIGETREVFNSKTVRHQEFISSQRSQLKPLKNQDILEYLEDLKNFKFKFENQI